MINPLIGNEYDSNKIPEGLKKDANAVIRSDNSKLEIESIKKAYYTSKSVITILNKKGDHFANLYVFYDKYRKIDDIQAKVFDSGGKLIHKIKSRDFNDQSISSGGTLYDDNRVKYYTVFQTKYPYTVEFEYTIKLNGFIHFPMWLPVNAYNVAVENSEYIVKSNADIGFHYKSVNIGEPIIKEENGEKFYNWSIQNYPAIVYVPFNPFLFEFTPAIHFAPNDFYFDGYQGSQSTWYDLGKWANQLLENRDQLSDKTRQEIQNIISLNYDKAKTIKKIYEYMQSRTRYVSIQLGIGGFQPFSALEVDNLGYGDCKALSNYMVSLLKEAGIESYYAIVRAGKNTRNIYSDFASVGQMNHVIVCVPLENDTLWLECTDQEQPFGFLGSFTDDRKALLIKPEGGVLVRTSNYGKDNNIQSRKINVNLLEEGKILAEIKTDYKAIQYDNISQQFKNSKEDQQKYLYKNIKLTNFKILNFNYEQDKKPIPEAKEHINIQVNQYASISGKRMFLPLNLLNKHEYVPKKLEERKTDIVLNYAYSDYDTIVYNIPKEYNIEYIPESIKIVSQFGEYKSYTTEKNGSLLYIRINKRNKGRFPADSYDQLIEFYKDIAKADQQKAILIKG